MAMAHILVVEDETTTAMQYEHWLKRAGYTVDIASSVDDALEKAKEVSPDLLLVDILLDKGKDKPEKDGVDFVEEMQARGENIPVIYATGHFDDDPTKERADMTKPFRFWYKPITETQLLEAVEMAL